MVDFVEGAFNTKLKIGMIVAYPVRRGSSMWLVKAKIVDLGTTTDRYDREYSWIEVEALDKNEYSSEYMKQYNKVASRKRVVTNVHNVVPLG